ncbi:MAG TPA: type II toxin-antitoxin system RelE/ParE family toxin [archaeon]|nr:type II toxin-antitoxin system RelE/ParE family toxin [archaeon]HLD80880.1 type II toxin-antitoxin system RelE/ParE family toxin [archaeon]
MYSIEFSELAEKQFKKLERALQDRISRALERIRVRPQDYLRKLVGDPGYRLRVGDYRVIIDVQREKLLLLVIKVGHRSNVYKNP